MIPDIVAAKCAARAAALARREMCDPSLGTLLTGHVLAENPPPVGAVVAGFWPLPGEIDIRPLLAALHARGNAMLLPETPPRGRPLVFRRWTPGVPLVAGRFGTRHPDGPAGTPDFVLVPLLAFDLHGNRLGYGAGYYDRTLAGLQGTPTLGCAFAAQEMTDVPTEPHDIRLQAVATEAGIIRCRAA